MTTKEQKLRAVGAGASEWHTCLDAIRKNLKVASSSSPDVVYAVRRCDDTYESAYYVHSLHRTKKGAVREMARMKAKAFCSEDWEFMGKYTGFGYCVYHIEE